MKLKDFLKEESDEPIHKEYYESIIITLTEVGEGRIKYNMTDKAMKSFQCSSCNLKTLENTPNWINDNFICSSNLLKDFTDGPKYVGGDFHSHNNPLLTSIEGAPLYVGGMIRLYDCPKLKSLTGLGRKWFKEVKETFFIGDEVESHILGMVLCKTDYGFGITKVSKQSLIDAINIVNPPIVHGQEHDLLDVQEELIQAGLKEYAKL